MSPGILGEQETNFFGDVTLGWKYIWARFATSPPKGTANLRAVCAQFFITFALRKVFSGGIEKLESGKGAGPQIRLACSARLACSSFGTKRLRDKSISLGEAWSNRARSRSQISRALIYLHLYNHSYNDAKNWFRGPRKGVVIIRDYISRCLPNTQYKNVHPWIARSITCFNFFFVLFLLVGQTRYLFWRSN